MTLGYGKVLEEEVKESVISGIQKFEKFDWDVEEANLKIKNPEAAFKTLVYIYNICSRIDIMFCFLDNVVITFFRTIYNFRDNRWREVPTDNNI